MYVIHHKTSSPFMYFREEERKVTAKIIIAGLFRFRR
jgi:hypothetical protein